MTLKSLTTTIPAVLGLGLLLTVAPARAEFRHIDLKTFGMD